MEIRGTDRVEEIVLAVNRLETGDDGRTRAVDTGARETVPCGLVLRAIGYRGVALPGVPFDEAGGTIPHETGRVTGGDREYVVGWIKRGPSGIIGTNRKDANETVRALLADLATGDRDDAEIAPAAAVAQWLTERCPDLIDLADWNVIDTAELRRGAEAGRPRVKVTTRTAFMDLVRASR